MKLLEMWQKAKDEGDLGVLVGSVAVAPSCANHHQVLMVEFAAKSLSNICKSVSSCCGLLNPHFLVYAFAR